MSDQCLEKSQTNNRLVNPAFSKLAFSCLLKDTLDRRFTSRRRPVLVGTTIGRKLIWFFDNGVKNEE